jgi:hypothetical protein
LCIKKNYQRTRELRGEGIMSSPAQIAAFETEEEAIKFADELAKEWGKERVFIFYEPEYCPKGKPYSVNLD